MRRAGHYLVYVALRALWTMASRLPFRFVRRVFEQAADLVRVGDSRHRRIVRENLTRAFPQWSAERRAEAEREAFRAWARIAAELAHAEEMTTQRTRASVQAVVERADELVEHCGGALGLTAHTGNFELLARLIGSLGGRRVSLFHRRMANRFVERFLLDQRVRANVDTLGRGIVVRKALRLLNDGEILVVPLDQNQSPRKGVFVDFFGTPASTSTMLARLSLATGIPVQPVFAAWEGDDLIAVLEDPIHPPASLAGASREQAIRELTERYTAAVEAMVRRYPTQWNWAHRRWKTQPEPSIGESDVGPGRLAGNPAPPKKLEKVRFEHRTDLKP
jgi:KDO2-lipid IV(A) lauroyltransferase